MFPEACGEAPRSIAHIGLLFPDLADFRQLSFFRHSFDSTI
jgi:hypothetical protein